MMGVYPNYDVSYWNLDGLEISNNYQSKGILLKTPIDSYLSKAESVQFLTDGRVAVFSKTERCIYVFDYVKGKFSLAYELNKDMDWICIKSYKGNIYALNEKKTVDFLYLNEKTMKFNHIHSYEIKCEKLDETMDIAIGELEKQHPIFPKRKQMVKIAVIGPYDNLRCAMVYLDKEYQGQEEIKVSLPREYSANTVKSCFIAVDNKNDSLVIVDKEQEFIFEYSLNHGYSTHICGGKMQAAEEGCNAKEACIRNPGSIVVYRPQDFITKGDFTNSSRNILDIDKNGIKPRYFYFCDTGSNTIKKIVDFPESAKALKLSGFNKVYTLIGRIPHMASISESDEKLLISHELKNPKSISVSDKGELCFLSDNSIYILRPASSLSEEKSYMVARESNVYVS